MTGTVPDMKLHHALVVSTFVSSIVASLAGCADLPEAGTAEPVPAGFVAMSDAEVAAAMIDDGQGGRGPLTLADGELAYLGLDQDVDAEPAVEGTAALLPCGHIQSFWSSVWVPHYALICNRTGTCSTITTWLPEPVDCEQTCDGPSTYQCAAHHTNGTSHLVTTPTTEADVECQYACTPHSFCEGCVAQ